MWITVKWRRWHIFFSYTANYEVVKVASQHCYSLLVSFSIYILMLTLAATLSEDAHCNYRHYVAVRCKYNYNLSLKCSRDSRVICLVWSSRRDCNVKLLHHATKSFSTNENKCFIPFHYFSNNTCVFLLRNAAKTKTGNSIPLQKRELVYI